MEETTQQNLIHELKKREQSHHNWKFAGPLGGAALAAAILISGPEAGRPAKSPRPIVAGSLERTVAEVRSTISVPPVEIASGKEIANRPEAIIKQTDQELVKLMDEVAALHHQGSPNAFVSLITEKDGTRYMEYQMIREIKDPHGQVTYSRFSVLADPGTNIPSYSYIENGLPNPAAKHKNYDSLARGDNQYSVVQVFNGKALVYKLSAEGAFMLEPTADKTSGRYVATSLDELRTYLDDDISAAIYIVQGDEAATKQPTSPSPKKPSSSLIA